MGEQNVGDTKDNQKMRGYMRALLADVRAIERMLDESLFEDGIRRIGAEQEMFLVDQHMRPAPVAHKLLEHLDDPRLVHELALFNLEANLTPRVFGGDCLKVMEEELIEVLKLTREAAKKVSASPVLTGILPTLNRADLSLENMTPNPRYRALNDAIQKLRGTDCQFKIEGLDELSFTHNNVMSEACNSSFQLHFQVGPGEFAKLYNLAQVVTAPVLAAAVNSPLLFGHRLWHETRIALFQHSVDVRSTVRQQRNQLPRVHFGDGWVNDSVLELIRSDVTRFRIMLSTELDENPLAVLDRGESPSLSAFRLHNGTIWRWNRPCYGTSETGPHLRIENRVLPSGPSVIDQMANAAFYYGLMAGVGDVHTDVRNIMNFDDAKDNFDSAARHGLKARFSWFKGASYTAEDLIKSHLIPVAREGLLRSNIDSGDIDRYLGTLEERVEARKTGSTWMLGSLASMNKRAPKDARNRALISSTIDQQGGKAPVHKWDLASLDDRTDWRPTFRQVGHFMTTDLITVRPDDLVDLAAAMMEWKHVRHIPVENDLGHLVGLVTARDLVTLVAKGFSRPQNEPGPVHEIMTTNLVTVSAHTSSLDALKLMRTHNIGCLPVVDGLSLVGLVTSQDFLVVATALLTEQLQQE